MRHASTLLAAALFPMLLNAATFGPETPVSRPHYSSSFGQQTANGVACGDQSCVALWTEYNSIRPGLYSSVINADGSVQPLSSNVLRSSSTAYASIVWTGDHYLAMWFDSKGVVAAPLSRDGRISGTIQTLMATIPLNSVNTALVWNGRHAFAAFNTPDTLWMAILDENGSLVRPLALPLAAKASAGRSKPEYVPPSPTYAVPFWDVAAAGGTFAVAWVEPRHSTATLNVQRYADDGSPSDSAPMTLVENLDLQWTPVAIAGNATQFGLAYSLPVDGLHRLRLDAWTGAVDTLAVLPPTRSVWGVYWSGDDFVTYNTDYRTITTNRFSSTRSNILNVSPNDWITDVRVVSSAGGAVAVWTDVLNDTAQHVFGAVVDNDATTVVKGKLPVSVSAVPQTKPVLAASNSGGLLVWSEAHDGTEIVAQRVNAAGAPVGDLIMVGRGGAPAAAWVGNAYLVAWSENGVVIGTRVSSSGVVLDDPPRIFEHGGGAPILTSNGAFSLLTFLTNQGIESIRLDADGATIDPQPFIIPSQWTTGFATASNENGFLLTWSEYSKSPYSSATPPSSVLYAVRLTASGQRIDTAPIPIATGSHPAAASDGRDFLIVYNSGKLVAKRLLAEGSLAGSTAQDDGIVVDATVGAPSIAWSGSNYVVAWSVKYPDAWTLLSTTVDRDGTPIDTPRVLGRAESSLFDINAAVEAMPGAVFVAYSRGNAAEDGIPRVFMREVLNGPPRGRGVRR